MVLKAIFYCIVILFSITIVHVNGQLCPNTTQYGRCSMNSACGCLHMAGANNVGICGFLYGFCSKLTPCESTDNLCDEPHHICVHHPRCSSHPVCYPVSMIDQQVCPPIIIICGLQYI
ncbi:unnamed protein product [Adineta ricciae]|uniref:Uncharacterized protein n=1 Tax=Adineta ricciae TaxID=249248 RepID=A0A815WNP4_ADIRI|nr:unnamed protein product [Adineta ricciae]